MSGAITKLTRVGRPGDIIDTIQIRYKIEESISNTALNNLEIASFFYISDTK